VDSPELKSRQGVFGSPFFLNMFMQISDPNAGSIVDYLMSGGADLNYDPNDWPVTIANPVLGTAYMPSYWQLPVK